MSRRGRPVLVLTYWSFADALVQAYTLPYVRQIVANLGGGAVYLVTVEQPDRPLDDAQRKRIREELRGEGIRWIHAGYSHFGVVAALRAGLLLVRLWAYVVVLRMRAIHCWCMPAGALGYLLSITTGRPLVLDSYEPHAEAMVENGTWPAGGTAHRLLSWLEKRQSRRARIVIGVTDSMREYAARSYGATFERFYRKPACVDLLKFNPDDHARDALREELGWSDKIVCVYAGKFGGIYLDTEFFAFVRAAWDLWGDRFRLLLMTNTPEDDVLARLETVGVPPRAVRVSFEPHERVARGLAVADFAITPVKPRPSKRHCAPIIPPDISDDSDLIAANGAGVVVSDLSVDGWKQGLLAIDAMLRDEPRASRVARIRGLAETHRSYGIAERIYREVYGDTRVTNPHAGGRPRG